MAFCYTPDTDNRVCCCYFLKQERYSVIARNITV